jgi:hypothetical protein
MKFEISAQRLKNICDVINISTSSIGGKEMDLVEDCVINVSQGKISSSFSDQTPYFVGYVELTKNFKVIEEGKLQIADLGRLVSYIKSFSPTDNLIVEQDGGKIILKREVPYKIITIPKLSDMEASKREELADGLLKNINYDDTTKIWKSKKYEWKVYFEILANKFSEILDDLKLIGGEVKFPITITPQKVMLNLVSDDGSISIERNLEVSKLVNDENTEIKNVFSFGLDGVLKVIDEKVKVWVEKDAPLIVERLDVGDGLRYYYILPPYLG